MLDLRDCSVTTSKIRALREKADYCSLQANKATDSKLIEYWQDLAENWMKLERALMDKDGKPILPL